MGTKILKFLLAAAVVTALSSGSGNDAEARGRHAPPPHVVKQDQHGSERYIYLHNTQPGPIWAYFECSRHLTVVPIGIPGARVVEIRLKDIDADEECSLNHWRTQESGHSPPPWTPYSDGALQ